MPETNIEIALMKQEIKFTNEAIARIEKKLDSFPDIFATKDDHKNNRERIEILEKERKNLIMEILKWFLVATAGAIATIILTKL
jgi:hypothetical protein